MKKLFVLLLILAAVGVWYLSRPMPPAGPLNYGVSFSRFHSDELKLDWRQVYLALLDDLKVRKFRFSAHWPVTEPKEGLYDFTELDFQMTNAEKRNATVILAIGRRLPGWPECHVPDWAQQLPKEKQQEQLLKLIELLVTRYKTSPVLQYWQVENEAYLSGFAQENCAPLDEAFFQQEIDLVHKLDPKHPVMITDGGEFGLWYKAYKKSDVFGTTMYLYVNNRYLGPIRYPIRPGFFRAKQRIVELIFGKKPTMVAELEAEPWLTQPIVDTAIDKQLEQMNQDRFDEIIGFSQQTGFDTFYLWGAEWWYWMKAHGHPEFWDRAKSLLNH